MSEDKIEVLSPHDEEHRTYILVTGANSGLGFAICRRLIDEFVQKRPSFQSLTLIPTTRDAKKARETVAALQKYIRKLDEKWEENLSNRVSIQPELVDLTSLSSVRALATKLLDTIPHLDTIICNAGFGGTTGINWLLCFWTMATDLMNALTYPRYKISGIGYATAPQTPFALSDDADDGPVLNDEPHSNGQQSTSEKQPILGKVFTSNVFGHYLLSHFLLTLLAASPDTGRVIWISSLEAYPQVFHPNDLQALTTDKAYESSKRLTDILVLTSALPCTAPFVKRFLTPPITSSTDTSTSTKIQLLDNEDPEEGEEAAPRINLTDNDLPHNTTTSKSLNDAPHPPPLLLLSHPGICATNFVPLPTILQLLMTLAFYLARYIGSPWHTVSASTGANAPVWLALASREEIEDEEVGEGRGKWGSCVKGFLGGKEGVRRTEVVGWGVGGRVGERGGDGESMEKEVGSVMGIGEVATREEREEFEVLGRECWREMETLRVAWEERLGAQE